MIIHRDKGLNFFYLNEYQRKDIP